MTPTTPTPTADPATDANSLAASALPWAHRLAERAARGRPDLAEALTDAATDGVLRALRTWKPDGGASFRTYAGRVVAMAVRRARRRLADRPRALGLADLATVAGDLDPPARDRDPAEAADLADLPADLREAVRLVYGGGHTTREAGELLGVHKDTVRNRLKAAARLLAEDGAVRPVRLPGAKRVRGSIGH